MQPRLHFRCCSQMRICADESKRTKQEKKLEIFCFFKFSKKEIEMINVIKFAKKISLSMLLLSVVITCAMCIMTGNPGALIFGGIIIVLPLFGLHLFCKFFPAGLRLP